jgi:phosphoribosylformylglycinamidine cyclo-ligase
MKEKITYRQAGDDYAQKDPIKILAQKAASETGRNLLAHGFSEVSATRGESAYAIKVNDIFIASTIEGLGTKNLVADGTRKIADKTGEITERTYYDVLGHCTVATIVNDLVTIGAEPLTLHAYWAIGSNRWLKDKKRMQDLTEGTRSACDIALISWGGGETPTSRGNIFPGSIELAGAAVGIIRNGKRPITDENLQAGDSIILFKSNGVNANGISHARKISTKLEKGYATKLESGITYGEALLTKTNIYARAINDLLHQDVDIHYIANITGHGHQKIMRANRDYSYIIENIYEPPEVFPFIQESSGLTDTEMYETYNMGMDYAVFLAEKDVPKAQAIIQAHTFESIHAGFVEKGKRRVVIKPKGIVFEGKDMQLKA